ncbi:MAG: radical SAM protein, partial [Candidatus Omnitrophota bacterium]
KKIDELEAAGLTEIVVPMDSSDPLRHDALRSVSGCFDKAVKGLELARKKGLTTSLWVYARKSNINEVGGIVRLGEDLGVEYIFIFFTLLSGRFFDRFDELLTLEERDRMRAEFRGHRKVVFEFPTEKSPCSGGGYRHISVAPSGDVTFCPSVPYSYGNIAERPLAECLKDITRDYRRFSCGTMGQCIVNSSEYRKNCSAKPLSELTAVAA